MCVRHFGLREGSVGENGGIQRYVVMIAVREPRARLSESITAYCDCIFHEIRQL